MKKFVPIDLPRTGYELMNFPEEKEKRIKAIVNQATTGNKWEYAEAVPIDLSNEYFWAYWLNKTDNPIKKPLRGYGALESDLDQYKKTHFELNGGSSAHELSLSAVGDLMCTKGLEKAQNILYGDVSQHIFDSDIRFANLESTFSGGEIKPLSFTSDEGPKINLSMGQYRALVEHNGKRYDVVQLANNHIVDEGETGVNSTLTQLEKDGIKQVGVNKKENDASRTTITETQGLKIGWVGHTFFVNFRPLPEGKPWMVNITPFYMEKNPDLSLILQQIKYCRNEKCDLIIVSLHWGLEFEFYPHPQQREWAQIFADAGADIIIGHHPHVIQFSEVIHPKNNQNKDVPVIYSLGNLTPIFSCPASVLSLIAKFRIARDGNSTKITGMDLLPVALVQQYSESGAHLKLEKLKSLLEMQHDAVMKEYVNEMSNFADIVLGTSWRY